MTRRERLEAKAAKREQWADRADARAAVRFDKADLREEKSGIPFGQPILIGHHSEKRHRRMIDRACANMTKGCEEAKLAEHHRAKAAGLSDQLDRTIFSDDANAVEALTEKRTALEVERDWMKSANAYYKKAKTLDGWDGPEAMHQKAAGNLAVWRGVYGAPFPPYCLTNIGATIRAAKKRAEAIPKANAEREALITAAEAAGGVLIREAGNAICVTFTEKPARAVIDALKAARFYWSAGSWRGYRIELPQMVRDMANTNAARGAGGAVSGPTVASGTTLAAPPLEEAPPEDTSGGTSRSDLSALSGADRIRGSSEYGTPVGGAVVGPHASRIPPEPRS